MSSTAAMASLAAVVALLLGTSGCAHRYSEDPKDWVGPRKGDFEADFSVCRQRMEDTPFRYGRDPREIAVRCIKEHGWLLKGWARRPFG